MGHGQLHDVQASMPDANVFTGTVSVGGNYYNAYINAPTNTISFYRDLFLMAQIQAPAENLPDGSLRYNVDGRTVDYVNTGCGPAFRTYAFDRNTGYLRVVEMPANAMNTVRQWIQDPYGNIVPNSSLCIENTPQTMGTTLETIVGADGVAHIYDAYGQKRAISTQRTDGNTETLSVVQPSQNIMHATQRYITYSALPNNYSTYAYPVQTDTFELSTNIAMSRVGTSQVLRSNASMTTGLRVQVPLNVFVSQVMPGSTSAVQKVPLAQGMSQYHSTQQGIVPIFRAPSVFGNRSMM